MDVFFWEYLNWLVKIINFLWVRLTNFLMTVPMSISSILSYNWVAIWNNKSMCNRKLDISSGQKCTYWAFPSTEQVLAARCSDCLRATFSSSRLVMAGQPGECPEPECSVCPAHCLSQLAWDFLKFTCWEAAHHHPCADKCKNILWQEYYLYVDIWSIVIERFNHFKTQIKRN